jgi:hypothetical protein
LTKRQVDKRQVDKRQIDKRHIDKIASWQNDKLKKNLDSRKQNIWPSMTGQKFAPMNAQHNDTQYNDTQRNDI